MESKTRILASQAEATHTHKNKQPKAHTGFHLPLSQWPWSKRCLTNGIVLMEKSPNGNQRFPKRTKLSNLSVHTGVLTKMPAEVLRHPEHYFSASLK